MEFKNYNFVCYTHNIKSKNKQFKTFLFFVFYVYHVLLLVPGIAMQSASIPASPPHTPIHFCLKKFMFYLKCKFNHFSKIHKLSK